jgi:hypothetical protein
MQMEISGNCAGAPTWRAENIAHIRVDVPRITNLFERLAKPVREPLPHKAWGDVAHAARGKPTINRTGRDADARTTCNECRCRSDYFIRASRNFFALKSFFSRISQEVVMAKRPGKTRASDASTPERTERIQFKVSTDEIAAIDEFRFQTRMPNRATAIRELLRRGLGAPKTERG